MYIDPSTEVAMLDSKVAAAKIIMSLHDDFDCDEATLTIRLSGEAESKEELYAQYEETRRQVLTALIELGMPEGAYHETPFACSSRTQDVYQRYARAQDHRIVGTGRPASPEALSDLGEYIRTGETEWDYFVLARVEVGYRYNASITAKIPMRLGIHKKAYAEMLRLDDQLEDKVSITISYYLADDILAKKSLMEEAVQKARDNAQTLAAAAGSGIGECVGLVYAAEDDAHGSGNARYEAEALQRVPDRGADLCMAESIRSNAATTPDFSPAPVRIECAVATAWELGDGEANTQADPTPQDGDE